MGRGFQRVCRVKVRRFQEVAAAFGCEEHNGTEDNQEDHYAQDVFNGVVRMERDAVQRYAVFIFQFFDFHAVRVVRTDFVQGDNVRYDQAEQYQRYGNDVQGEEAVQSGIGNGKVTTNPNRQILADHRNSGE